VLPLRRLASSLVLAAAVTSSRAAPADSPPVAVAAELLDAQATSLMQERRYAEACPKFAESDRIKPGTGVLLRLGLCYELSGRIASAWATFRAAEARARRAADASVAELASRRAEGLEPRLAKLVVRLAPDQDPTHVEVQLDDAPIAPGSIGVELPIDPGAHKLRAAAGDASFARSFVVADAAATTTIAVVLAPASSASPAPASPSAERGSLRRTAAIVAGVVGVAGIAVGSGLGIAAMSNWNKARSECTAGTSGCSRDALDLQPVVRDEAMGSTVAFTVGAVGAVGAVLLWWLLPAPADGRRAASSAYAIRPSLDPRDLGVRVQASF
jgi:hypothetical protein